MAYLSRNRRSRYYHQKKSRRRRLRVTAVRYPSAKPGQASYWCCADSARGQDAAFDNNTGRAKGRAAPALVRYKDRGLKPVPRYTPDGQGVSLVRRGWRAVAHQAPRRGPEGVRGEQGGEGPPSHREDAGHWTGVRTGDTEEVQRCRPEVLGEDTAGY
ncbi:hypothetical protein THAOC_35805 [Thalassiosira oceanica]|uniref:Uncharacterized protein n=1 Tax=Thalassiosira oceanica TaxID=159749 RepID=K0R9H8_THAOC|nr:hypothetical protein THAOC_35805 [Thalassiosira oceanica]|eukprot:EJK45576.1 hypothetical protein THAOC_35805 [Thalassiosira oceanica]